MDISIIIPVYNTDKYIKRCLNSIYNQNFNGTFEVIAVDDASTDNSMNILKSYQKNEKRLKIVEHNSNKKLTKARTSGMRVSTGDYVMHLDSDDWLLPNALEKLFAEYKSTNADVIVYNYIKACSDGKTTPVHKIKKKVITDEKLKVSHYFLGAAVNKIVKRSLVENMLYGDAVVNAGEDLLYSMEILLAADRICLIPVELYAYFTNKQSLTHTMSWESRINNIANILPHIQNIYIKYKGYEEIKIRCLEYIESDTFLYIVRLLFSGNIENKGIKAIVNLFNILSEGKIDRVNKYKYLLRNKYFCFIQIKSYNELKAVLGIIVRYLICQNKNQENKW